MSVELSQCIRILQPSGLACSSDVAQPSLVGGGKQSGVVFALRYESAVPIYTLVLRVLATNTREENQQATLINMFMPLLRFPVAKMEATHTPTFLPKHRRKVYTPMPSWRLESVEWWTLEVVMKGAIQPNCQSKYRINIMNVQA